MSCGVVIAVGWVAGVGEVAMVPGGGDVGEVVAMGAAAQCKQTQEWSQSRIL